MNIFKINTQDIFLMVEKQVIDTVIEMCKTMPPELAKMVAYDILKGHTILGDMDFKIKVFEYTETKEHNILATYTIQEFTQIILP